MRFDIGTFAPLVPGFDQDRSQRPVWRAFLDGAPGICEMAPEKLRGAVIPDEVVVAVPRPAIPTAGDWQSERDRRLIQNVQPVATVALEQGLVGTALFVCGQA